MANRISRRDFLRGTAASLVGIAASGLIGVKSPVEVHAENGEPSWFTAPAKIDSSMIKDTVKSDVVIIGAGLSGMSAAASCFENGLSVSVVEKGAQARAFGLDFGCVNSSLAKEYGIKEYSKDDIYKMARRWVAESGGLVRPDHVLSFLTNSGRAVDWITDKAEKWGCTPVIAAYSSNSDTYENVKGIVEFHNGPTWSFENESFGARDVVNCLTDELEKGGYPVHFNTEAVELVKDDTGRVCAAICKNKDGEYICYEAELGVILAAGDFAGDKEMLQYYSPWNYDSYEFASLGNYSSGKGEGQKLGMWAGGQMDKKQPIMFLPFTYPYFYLHVNKNGERFMNEDSNSVGMSVGQLSQPQGIAYSIWDSKWNKEIPASLEFGGGMDWDQDFRTWDDPWNEENEQATHDYNVETGNLVICDTIEELAESINVPVENLKNTVERYNQLVADGWDADFGKRPELLTSISEPPYYALRMNTGLCVSVGGLKVDVNHQVTDVDGQVIPGLFAIGNNASDLHVGGEYIECVVPGNSLGRCVTFGKLIGEYLAASKK